MLTIKFSLKEQMMMFRHLRTTLSFPDSVVYQFAIRSWIFPHILAFNIIPIIAFDRPLFPCGLVLLFDSFLTPVLPFESLSCWAIVLLSIHSLTLLLSFVQLYKPIIMQFKAIIITALTAAPALALTNGSLGPAYICNPQADGLPKSFGRLLPYTCEPTTKVGFSTNDSFSI